LIHLYCFAQCVVVILKVNTTTNGCDRSNFAYVAMRIALFSDALIFEVYIAGVEGNPTKSKIRNFAFKHYLTKILTL
jgi:hypothetical protein